MKPEEAIDYLQDPIGKREKHDEAIQMAIEALKAQSKHDQNTMSKQPDLDKLGVKTGETCADAISRQAAIDYCYALINAENPSDSSDHWNYSQERISQTEVILHHLEFMPSAQPEIIHCKECKYAHMTYDGDCKYCDVWFPDESKYVGGDYYCASAERKTDD